MAKTGTVWNPLADAFNESYGMERLGGLKREEQAQSARYGSELEDQRSGNALKNTLAGKAKDREYKDEDADREAASLRSMLTGRPDAAKALGFTQTGPGTRAGAMLEPEAMGAPVPSVTTGRQPSYEEARGLARGVPGIAGKLLDQNMKGRDPYSLAPGAKRFDADNNLVAENPKGAEAGQERFPDSASAMADAKAKGFDPGRVTVKQDAHGWTYSTGVTESLAEGPSKWIADSNDISKSPAERARAAAMLDQDEKRQLRITQGKEDIKPLQADDRMRLQKTTEAISAAYNIRQFTPTEREGFTGLGKLGYEGAAAALEAGGALDTVARRFGYTPQQVQRYQEFKKYNGMIEQFKFVIGGKQLTIGEQRVVEAFIPTGREFTTGEYEAKMQGIAKAMEAAQAVELYVATVGKGFVDSKTMREIYVRELQQRGIDVTAKPQENIQNEMRAGDRLRDKWRAK